MRVQLVYSNQSRDVLPAPPLGLSYVADATSRAGHEVDCVDLLFAREPLAKLRAAIERFRPEVVGFSVRNIDNVVQQISTGHLDSLKAMIATTRESSQATIVLGGPAISILGTSSLAHFDADYAVVGEGEEAFPQLLSALATGQPCNVVEGVCFRRNGEIALTQPTRLPTFGASGMGRWIDWATYERGGATWAVQTKRGCPMGCSYCCYPLIEGHSKRTRSAKEVVDEIEHVAATVGPRAFEFVDSTFNVPEEHAQQICREIIRRGLKVKLTAMGLNPAHLSAELLELMKRAGFLALMITPEAASDTMLRSLRKGFLREDVVRCAERVAAARISSAWFFMLGGPGETRETVNETASFIEEQLVGRRFLSIVTTGIRIFPGTELARLGVAEGIVGSDEELIEPRFYPYVNVDEQWILTRINLVIARNANVVHAAEGDGSIFERIVPPLLDLLGVAPPYWRFLPTFLKFPPLPLLRTHFPEFGSKGTRLDA